MKVIELEPGKLPRNEAPPVFVIPFEHAIRQVLHCLRNLAVKDWMCDDRYSCLSQPVICNAACAICNRTGALLEEGLRVCFCEHKDLPAKQWDPRNASF